MRKRRRGFTLIEVLIAMAIMAGGIIVVTQAWSGNFLRVRKTNLYNNVTMLLERKVTELQAQYREKTLDEITDKSGDFGSDLPNYRWEFTTHQFEMPDLSALLLGGDSGQGQNAQMLQMVQQMTQEISKAVKEGKVTVYVKAGKREVPFSVTTYFINYGSDLGLPGGSK